MKSKGFTLIELLVVIAIIGILASIVLVSFPGAQKKAKDSRVVSAIAQMRTVMQYIEANNGNYTSFNCAVGTTAGDCTSCSDSDLLPLCNEAKKNSFGGTELGFNTCATCSASAGPAACVWAQLTAKSTWYYCADSTGVAGFTATDPGSTANLCNGTTAVCPAGMTN